MNRAHRWLCSSNVWRTTVEQRLIPWALHDLDLGASVLEIGPGPGLTSARLSSIAPELTCLEIDKTYASSLYRRMNSANVRVVCADAAAMPLRASQFDAVVCFTMLHHVSSPALQDRLLAEALRVLRPGGIFAGVDSLSSGLFRLLHLFDTMVMIDPSTFPKRLETAGFERIQLDIAARRFRFRAKKPSGEISAGAARLPSAEL